MLAETIQSKLGQKTLSVSRRSLLTDDQQNELIYIRDTLLSSYFRIGDIANDAILNNSSRGGVTEQMVFDEVGVWVGKSGRTVRYYAESASFFSPLTRSEYEMIPFTHFDLARNYGDNWRIVLEISKASPGLSLDRVRLLANAVLSEKSEVRLAANEENLSTDSDVRVRACAIPEVLEELDSVLERVVAEEKGKKKPPGLSASVRLVGRLMSLVAEVRLILGECDDLSPWLAGELEKQADNITSLIPRILHEIDGRGEEG